MKISKSLGILKCNTKAFCPFFHFLKHISFLFNHELVQKIWNSISDSDRALPKYIFKNTLQRRLLDILIQEDTYMLACVL